jgi:hypothetical protein
LLDQVFDKWWPDLASEVSKILQQPTKTKEVKRTDRDILEEVLSLVRSPAKTGAELHDQGFIRATLEDFALRFEELARVININDYLHAANSVYVMGKTIAALAERYGLDSYTERIEKTRRSLRRLMVRSAISETDNDDTASRAAPAQR